MVHGLVRLRRAGRRTCLHPHGEGEGLGRPGPTALALPYSASSQFIDILTNYARQGGGRWGEVLHPASAIRPWPLKVVNVPRAVGPLTTTARRASSRCGQPKIPRDRRRGQPAAAQRAPGPGQKEGGPSGGGSLWPGATGPLPSAAPSNKKFLPKKAYPINPIKLTKTQVAQNNISRSDALGRAALRPSPLRNNMHDI